MGRFIIDGVRLRHSATPKRRPEIREEFSFLYKRSSSLETSSREIGFGTRRAPQLRRSPDLPPDLENPGEVHVDVSRRFVPISATGLEGKEPLVDRLMQAREVGKFDPYLRNKDWL